MSETHDLGNFALLNGQWVKLPHPDLPCVRCHRMVMGDEACPNFKNTCTECCGEDH